MVVHGLPGWLIEGVALGLVAAAGVFIVYYVGVRYFRPYTAVDGRIDPNEVRRAEVRAYLAAIGERADERVTIEGFAVDFWLPERQVAVTFDARTYFALRRQGVEAVLLEHEVPGHQIGPRLPFETPPLSRGTDRADEQRWAYECLGVDADADQSAIEAAYRERILEVHPDHGGDTESLTDVLRAYEVVGDHSPS